MIRLKTELESAGYEGEADDFRDRLIDLLVEMFRSWTAEELLYHPREATHFCNVARRAAHTPELPDYVILRTLQNVRKAQRNDKVNLRSRKVRERRNAEAVAT